jgi:4'-phosphopantetheinyl transferase
MDDRGFLAIVPPAATETWHGVDFVAARLNLPAAEVNDLKSSLSEPERRRSERFASGRDSRRFIVARARLRQLLGLRLGISASAVGFSYGPHGKPQLSRQFTDANVRFNLSHSCDIAIYGFSIGRELGVDVEALRPLPDANDIATRFFSRTEHQAFSGLAAIDRTAGFFNCWTRKEAVVKALGDGLHYSLQDFDVSLAPGEGAKVLRLNDMPGERCGWDMGCLHIPGFAAAVVVENVASLAAAPARARNWRSKFLQRAISAATASPRGRQRNGLADAAR